MRFPFVVSLALAVLPHSVWAQAHTVREVDPCVRVRALPNTNAEERACLTTGTGVMVIGSEPFWREITFDPNGRGWMAKKFLPMCWPNGRTS